MKNVFKNQNFKTAAILAAVFCVGCLIIYASSRLLFFSEYNRQSKFQKEKEIINEITRLASLDKPFILTQATNDINWDEARLITYQYDTGFGTNENDDYYCKVDCTNNPEYNILVFFKDKKYVFDFSFNTYKEFTFADNLETISADTVFVPAKADTSSKYILSIK